MMPKLKSLVLLAIHEHILMQRHHDLFDSAKRPSTILMVAWQNRISKADETTLLFFDSLNH